MFAAREWRVRYASPQEATLALFLALSGFALYPVSGDGFVIQPPQLRHFYPASRVMSCMLCPSASSITSFGVR
jgi:hypothetical protein